MKYKNILEQGFAHMVALVVVAIVAVGAITVFVTQRGHASTCVGYTYAVGVNGSTCVKDIQILLNGMASHPGWGGNGYRGGQILAVDGSYGPATRQQVIVFQNWYNSFNSSHISVDGVVGPQTWGHLCGYTYFNNGFSAQVIAAGQNAGCPKL